MYLTIKAFSMQAMKDFHKAISGDVNNRNSDNLIFDEIFLEDLKITFYNNLTVFFTGRINKEIESKIDLLIDKNLYVGIDEVGVGESIGPLVVCGLRFKDFESKKRVIMHGIKDSKKLNWAQIQDVAKVIKENADFQLVALEPKKFNETFKKVQNTKAINAIIQNEINKKMAGYGSIHITDQFVNEKKYIEYINNSENDLFKGKLIFETKSEEKYLEVAAAAILSKEYFNNWVLDFFAERGYNLNIENKLRSWDLFEFVRDGKIEIKDKENLIKDWTK